MENVTSTILTLDELDEQNMSRVIGPILYLVVLMAVGIPGNLTVLVIYRRKYSKSVYRTLIWNLALTDLLFCTLTIPFNIGRLIRYYTFNELWVCKLFTTLILFFIIYSSNLIVILAVHRYRKVLMRLKNQINPRNVRYWIFGGFLLAVFLDIPQGCLQSLDPVKLAGNITGHVCAVSFHASIYTEIYNGFLTFFFTFYSLVLLIMYVLIGRRMYLQRKIKEDTNQTLSPSDEISRKITKIAITISAVFALSYIPLFLIKTLSIVIKQEELTSTEFGMIKILERAYVINHIANPFIYAFYDTRFRKEVRMLFTGVTKREQTEDTTEDKETSIDRTLESIL